MYGLNILARSSRALSLRLWSAHRRTVCRIAFSAFGLAAGRKETPSLPARQTAVLGRNSYPRKSKRLDRIISLTVSIPAVDELRLLRMQNQPAGPETALQGAPQCPSLLGTSTMADEVVRISFEWDAGKVPHHPHVEGVVQEQIREARAYHPTLRSSPYAVRCRHPPSVPEPSASARCRGAPKGNPYVYGPLSGAVPNRCCRSSSERRRLAPSRTASSAGGSPGLHQSPTGPAGSHRSPHGRSLPGWAP